MVIWDGIDSQTGLKFLDHFPPQSIVKKNDTELKVVICNGSIVQIVGSDNYDSIMGTNPVGCVFSEYSLQDSRAWDYVRPILAENGGWAVFIYTPRGRNHGYTLYEMAKRNPEWFCERLTVSDTKREDGTPVVPLAIVEAERAAGMSDEMIDQEFYCSFEAAVQGAYYAKQMAAARKEGRITRVPHQPGQEVFTAWDLGLDDSMTIWFFQPIGKSFNMIDYYENSNYGLEHYAKVLKGKPYVYGGHIMPHDADQREMTNGEIPKTRKEVAEALGVKPVQVVTRAKNMDIIINVHIPAVRNVLGSCWFDEEKCARGIAALDGYHSEYDEEKKILHNRPVHDWTSHGSDGFRTFAVGYVDKLKAGSGTGPVTPPHITGAGLFARR